MKPKKPWWQPIVDTIIHVAIASAMFVIIALPALGLSFLVKWMESQGLPSYSLTVLTFLEHVIVTVDALGVLLYIGSMIYRNVKGPGDDDES